jgi:hypothetical protein
MSSVITIFQPPTVPGDAIHPNAPTAMTFAPVNPDLDPDELDIDILESSEPEVIESSTSTIVEAGKDDKQTRGESCARSAAEARRKKTHEAARMESLEKLQRVACGDASAATEESSAQSDREKGNGIVKLSWKRSNAEASARHQQMASHPAAVIVLKEEKVWSFTGCFSKLISLAWRRAPFMTSSGSFILGGLFCNENRYIILTFDAAWSVQSPGTTWRVS